MEKQPDNYFDNMAFTLSDKSIEIINYIFKEIDKRGIKTLTLKP